MKILLGLALTVLLSLTIIRADFAQDNSQADSIDLTVIDSYVSPELPHTFLLTFFTGFNCKSKIIIDKAHEYVVSDTLTSSHTVKVDLTNLSFKAKTIPYSIVLEDSAGKNYTLTGYEINLPGEVKIQSESNFLLLCLFGGAVFALPDPTYVYQNGQSYFSLSKEIPIISFRGSNFTYPFGYISAEYSHIFKAPSQNFMRIGYKEIIPVPIIEYVSPGIDGFTSFKGFNGISAGVSLGLFRIFNTFTVYARYRFNSQPNNGSSNFHEVSFGLYSSFFSVYL